MKNNNKKYNRKRDNNNGKRIRGKKEIGQGRIYGKKPPKIE